VDDNWLEGTVDGRSGIFPKTYIKVSCTVDSRTQGFEFTVGMDDIKTTGDNYHVLKYHDIRCYHDNAFWLVFGTLFVN